MPRAEPPSYWMPVPARRVSIWAQSRAETATPSMVGVGSAKGDVITFNFEEQPTGFSKKVTRASAAAAGNTFGKATGIKKLPGAEKRLNDRR